LKLRLLKKREDRVFNSRANPGAKVWAEARALAGVDA
jgi:hypothetical protein